MFSPTSHPASQLPTLRLRTSRATSRDRANRADDQLTAISSSYTSESAELLLTDWNDAMKCCTRLVARCFL
jgi:hypothetical protein